MKKFIEKILNHFGYYKEVIDPYEITELTEDLINGTKPYKYKGVWYNTYLELDEEDLPQANSIEGKNFHCDKFVLNPVETLRFREFLFHHLNCKDSYTVSFTKLNDCYSVRCKCNKCNEEHDITHSIKMKTKGWEH